MTIDLIVRLAQDAGLDEEGGAKLRRDLELYEEGRHQGQNEAQLPLPWLMETYPAISPHFPPLPDPFRVPLQVAPGIPVFPGIPAPYHNFSPRTPIKPIVTCEGGHLR